MRATIVGYALKTRTTHDGKKFKVLEIRCECKNQYDDVTSYRGTFSVDYMKKYFDYCGRTTDETIGCPCEISIAKREFETDEGEIRRYTCIRFFNLVDADGKPIIMKKSDNEDVDF